MPQSSVIIETATLHIGSCTRTTVTTYSLDSRGWIVQQCRWKKEQSTTYLSDQNTLPGSCTRSTCRVTAYCLDSSSRIHAAMNVEENVVYHIIMTVMIEIATFHAGTCTRSRVSTYWLEFEFETTEQCMCMKG